jgi:hypothetical protein
VIQVNYETSSAFGYQPTILLDELARRGAYTVYRIAQGGLSPKINPQSAPQSSM